MRKYFFKAAFIALIAVLATFLSAGLVSLNGEKALADGEITKTYEDTTVTAFGDVNGTEKARLKFALSANDYSSPSQHVNATQVASLNWGYKIKITIGGEEKTLADYYLPTEVYLQLWTRPNIISVNFNGDYTTITKLVIEEGCEFPSSETATATDNLKVYRTTEEAVFYNVGAAMFYKEAAYTVASATETKVETFGDPSGEVTARMFFGLSVNDYSAATQAVSSVQSGKLNWNTKIKITINGEEKVLAAYAPIAETYLRIFDRAGAPVALTTSLSDYKTIEKIVIEKGCHFPSSATANNEDNFDVFVTTEAVTFIGDGNGHFTKCVGQTAVTAIGDPSDDRQKQFLWVCLDTNDYNTPNNPIELWQFSALNTGSKIKLTVAGEVKTLNDYGIGQSNLNYWGRSNMIAIGSGLADYTVATKIVVEKGCQFPANVSAGHKATANYFETTENVVFVNDGTGKFLNLADVKFAAKEEIVKYKSENLYRAEEKVQLAAIISKVGTAIENGETYEEITAIVTAAKAEIDKLKTDAQYAAEELAVAKTAAKAEIEGYKNADDYREAQKTELAKIIADGKTAIDSCETIDSVTAKVAEIKTLLDSVKTDAEMTAEELAAAKTEAKAEIANYKNAADYRTAEQTKLSEIIANAQNDIDSATVITAIKPIIDAAKAEIDKLKTDAQYAAEELAAAKTAAKAEIEGYKNADDYREAQKTELAKIIADGKTAIDSCETIDSVTAKVAEIKTLLDSVKTDAEITAEEKVIADYIVTVKAKVDSFAADIDADEYTAENKAQIDSLIEKCKADLDGAKTKDEADKLYENVVKAVANVEKKPTETDSSSESTSGSDNNSADFSSGDGSSDEEVGGCFGTVESLAGVLSLLSVAAFVVIKKKKSI